LGVLVDDPDRQDPPATLRPPLQNLPETDAAPAIPYIAIAVAAIRIKAAKWRQHRHSLRARLNEVLNIAVADTDDASVGKLSRYVHIFQRAGLLTSTRNFCLPYSIMLTKFLRRRGFAAQLVIGVSGRPFAAHSWVQIGDMVINDTIDNISRFTPIVVA
jgi:transglutaminase-like putative cysteine protease